MKAFTILASAVALATLAAAPAAAITVSGVQNGGFETGSFDNWVQFGNTGFTGVVSGYPHSGTYTASFGPVGSVGGISQDVSTIAGQAYDLTFWLQNGDSGTNSFDVSFNGVTLMSIANASAFDWTQHTFTVAATGSSSLVEFTFRNDPDYFRLDSVSLLPSSVAGAVPEPGTWAMMLIGFGGIGFSMRKARRAKAVAAFA